MPFKCYQHEELKMPLFDLGSFVTEVHALHPWFYFCVQGEKKKRVVSYLLLLVLLAQWVFDLL